MEYLIGIGLAVAVCVFANVVRLDAGRVFYATLLIVVAHYYILFAVLGGSRRALGMESIGAVMFMALAVIGFKRNPWVLALGLAGHGLFDLVHPRVIEDPGVPAWWPAFCMSFDVAAGGLLAGLLVRRGKAEASSFLSSAVQ